MYYRARRIPTDVAATVKIGAEVLRIEILDVSDTGLKIKLGAQFPPQTPLTFQGVHAGMTGRIRWSDGRKAGVVLDRDLSKSEIARIGGMIWG